MATKCIPCWRCTPRVTTARNCGWTHTRRCKPASSHRTRSPSRCGPAFRTTWPPTGKLLDVPELPAQAEELYALPLEEFTEARNNMAAELRKSGDKAAADAVKGLEKPSITAWALNQVRRRQPEVVTTLLAAGEELLRAQQGLLAGRNPADFREATQAERQASAAV